MYGLHEGPGSHRVNKPPVCFYVRSTYGLLLRYECMYVGVYACRYGAVLPHCVVLRYNVGTRKEKRGQVLMKKSRRRAWK